MKKYTIYTQDKNIKQIERLLNNTLVIKGYTIIKTKGNWEGITEQALKIEILLPKHYNYQIKSLCHKIKRLNKQEAVLFTVSEIEAYFV